MSLWCCAYFSFEVHSYKNEINKSGLIQLLQTRYKIYNDKLNKIVLSFGTRGEVLELLAKEKDDHGNIVVKRNNQLDVVSETAGYNEIIVGISTSNIKLEEFEDRFKYIEEELKHRKRINRGYSGELGIFYLRGRRPDYENPYLVIGDYGSGYRCLSVRGHIKDIENRDLKTVTLINIKNGRRLGRYHDIPKIDVKPKNWDDFNAKIETYGSNWYIQYDGKIALKDSKMKTSIKLDELKNITRLEFADEDPMVTSLIIRTGPKVIGNLKSKCLNTVILPDTTEVIGKDALSCTNITSLDLKRCKNLRYIYSGAFSHIIGLKVLDLPDNVEKIGNSIIRHASVECLILPKNLKEINLGMFDGAGRLRIIVLPDTKLGVRDFVGKVYSKLPKLEEIWVTQENYESAVNFGEILNYRSIAIKRVKIVVVRRK